MPDPVSGLEAVDVGSTAESLTGYLGYLGDVHFLGSFPFSFCLSSYLIERYCCQFQSPSLSTFFLFFRAGLDPLSILNPLILYTFKMRLFRRTEFDGLVAVTPQDLASLGAGYDLRKRQDPDSTSDIPALPSSLASEPVSPSTLLPSFPKNSAAVSFGQTGN